MLLNYVNRYGLDAPKKLKNFNSFWDTRFPNLLKKQIFLTQHQPYIRNPKFLVMMTYSGQIAQRLNLNKAHVEAVLELFAEGGTIPFIARYRKDKTGAMDEVQIAAVQDTAKLLQEFDERKTFIVKTIAEQGKMTDALQAKIDAAATINELEDIYLPYKPKRKTKAQTARENGLEPLALLLLAQAAGSLAGEPEKYVNEKVATAELALQGARDIIAEMMNEDATVRAKMRKLFEDEANLQSKLVEDKAAEAQKFKDYFDYQEQVMKTPSHRALAVLRGFTEGFLRISIGPDEEVAVDLLNEQFVKGMSECSEHIKKAGKDAYRRLLQPSLETEFKTALKEKADEEAINVFAENLRQLLLSSPLGSKRMMAIDPGIRTGCKTVCLDEKGDLLCNDVIYLNSDNKSFEAERIVKKLIDQHRIEAIAIGDGTNGRETEKFIKGLQLGLPVFLVNEDGASIYSASEVARQEFPNEDITVRGAVSIGRRLMDPLAELVKIDPKSIGVGQYQHDVNQSRLKEKLDATVISSVNLVGVNVNTASKHLLSYVSGIGSTIAENIVKYRNEKGKINSRKDLLNVPRLGSKAFEQCAGFLRVPKGDHPLDASAVHPEAYAMVEQMAKDLQVALPELIGNTTLIKDIDAKKYVTETIGALTVQDILKELQKPGLDPRKEVTQFEFANVYKIEDLQIGMIVPGIVTNITKFGAFVDVGVKQDGLVHISQVSHQYITDAAEVLKLNQQVQVKVMEVDMARQRIALSIKEATEKPANSGGGRKPFVGKPNASAKPAASVQPENFEDSLSLLKSKFKRH
jgi:protein Tex